MHENIQLLDLYFYSLVFVASLFGAAPDKEGCFKCYHEDKHFFTTINCVILKLGKKKDLRDWDCSISVC